MDVMEALAVLVELVVNFNFEFFLKTSPIFLIFLYFIFWVS